MITYIIDDKLDIKGECLVLFHASWCGPCRMLEPVLEEIKDEIEIMKIDVDKNEKLCKEYGIMSVPTLIHFKDGKMEKCVGYKTKEELLSWLGR